MEPKNHSPQYYKKVVALSNKGHADWKIKTTNDYSFTSGSNAVLITAVEFSFIACEYPIVFVDTSGNFKPIAVLGLKPDQNHFLCDDNSWGGKYIPAYIRRYPFILSGDMSATNGQDIVYTVCIDESYIGFNKDFGENLFDSNGQYSAYLERTIKFLKDFQSEGQATEKFCRKLKKLDILEPMQAKVVSKDQKDFSLSGFWIVSHDRLKGKKPLELAELVKSDEMAFIYSHLSSLSKFRSLTMTR